MLCPVLVVSIARTQCCGGFRLCPIANCKRLPENLGWASLSGVCLRVEIVVFVLRRAGGMAPKRRAPEAWETRVSATQRVSFCGQCLGAAFGAKNACQNGASKVVLLGAGALGSKPAEELSPATESFCKFCPQL